ncbi:MULTISPECIES: molybdopterin converting factor subunit 1 [Bacillus]|uniref:Molybdopterin synthase sulfur carrier subunit n=2 Tax=Bacillus TaxID=1386 RepID=A0A0M5JL77_9BACI|nr:MULTISPECIES: molybdopterin converting factor subunit 1 [Bacillus]ALC80901.1 molybdenum cofactor biosynthesis protein MoaD [Bacillus gobiensis]MBP1079842.1 molybdopterin synthase sulfur carrier subunit [Bacillus capparidis]MED1095231.1 molybdopterin converting factor subunit 1 [Bacillus capparidis]
MITILLFAGLAEKAGTKKITLENEETTTGEIVRLLKENYQLEQVHQSMIAVNEEYTQGDKRVVSGDTVAFIPPVSGG